jgi:hypothetical protein
MTRKYKLSGLGVAIEFLKRTIAEVSIVLIHSLLLPLLTVIRDCAPEYSRRAVIRCFASTYQIIVDWGRVSLTRPPIVKRKAGNFYCYGKLRVLHRQTMCFLLLIR